MSKPLQTLDISFTVNGETQRTQGPETVSSLLARLCPDARMVAVERNGHVVPRRLHNSTYLAEGDRLEVVTIVGGG